MALSSHKSVTGGQTIMTVSREEWGHNDALITTFGNNLSELGTAFKDHGTTWSNLVYVVLKHEIVVSLCT